MAKQRLLRLSGSPRAIQSPAGFFMEAVGSSRQSLTVRLWRPFGCWSSDKYKLWRNNGCYVPQELSQPCPPFALPLICVSSVLMEDTRPIKKRACMQAYCPSFYCSRCLAKVPIKQSLKGFAVTCLVAYHLMNGVVDSVKA